MDTAGSRDTENRAISHEMPETAALCQLARPGQQHVGAAADWSDDNHQLSQFGYGNREKPTVVYRNFQYVKDCDNVCGTTSWRCRFYRRMKCNARLVTSGNRVVSNRQPDHTWNQHAG